MFPTLLFFITNIDSSHLNAVYFPLMLNIVVVAFIVSVVTSLNDVLRLKDEPKLNEGDATDR